MDFLPSIVAVLAAYLIGSLSFAVIVSRVKGQDDPRSYGSGNPGATNVLRSGNRAAALLTLAFDVLKGYVPVLLTLLYGARFGLGETTLGFVGLAAFVGHLWPVFFRFRGGKGVATAAGVLLAFNPWLGAATLLSWLIIAAFFRYSSLAAIVAAVFAPFFQLLVWGVTPLLLAICSMSLLLLWRHLPNMRRLIEGKETRLGAKPAGAPAGPTPKHPLSRHAAPHAHRPAHRKGHK
jgi:glycerol-3-phosphate acyltransferase PlsY